MKIKALVIAPYQGLAELTASLLDQLDDFDVTVIQRDLSESLEGIRAYEEQGYDIIISRGGTASRIREISSIPVVEIKISGFDILRLITLLKEYKTKIEMIGFPNIIEAAAAVSRLLDVHIPYTVIYEQDEVHEALENAKRKGALVIVGGSNTIRLAKEQGLQGILITSGRESVLEAFEHARNMHRAVVRHKEARQLLSSLADGAETGLGVVQPDGRLRYANPSFRRMLNIPADDDSGRSLAEILPQWTELAGRAGKAGEQASQVELPDPTYRYKMTAVRQPGREGEEYWNLYVRPIAEHEQEIRVRHLEPFLGTFPQLIRSREDFRQSVAAALASLQKHEPVTVYGERGTGKRILAGTLQQQLDAEESRLFDVTVIRGSDEAFAQLRRLLAEAQADSMILLRGLERFQPALQRRLVEVLGACRAYLVVAFEKPPQRLKEEGWLEEELYAFLGRTVVGMKPLRDNLGELEELIRIFISENNEKYGKQVVGIRPKVLDSFYTRPWKGNLIELRDTIGELVRSAQGEYIDEELLHWFEKNKSVKDAGSGSRTVNLDQPFQSIQKDIIQMVLQEENMNQSRAAKRLGLNRSTLWRILKDQP